MKYKIGDLITIVTEIRQNGNKYVVTDAPRTNSKLATECFQIVAKNETMQTYKIILADDMIGWQISQFHIEYEGVAKAFFGKRFYDISENHIVESK